MSNIWKREISISRLNELGKGTLLENLKIEFCEIGDDYLCAKMPVFNGTQQPFGLLHGGASVALAETVSSVAGNFACTRDYAVLGAEINANHLRAVRSGLVIAKARPLHLGSNSQVWEIEIKDEAEHLICISRATLAVRKKMKLKDNV